jgi:sulfite reductase (NADPH) flavoprotein alpha-component
LSNYSRTQPYHAKIQERYSLTKPGSSKETTHIALAVRDFPFEVGDSIGVFPENNHSVVDQILSVTGGGPIFDRRSNATLSFRDFLLTKANLTKCTSALLKLIPSSQTTSLLENKEQLQSFLQMHHLIDILRVFIPSPSPQELANVLLPLMPRFYSVASSPHMFPKEIHLTVASLIYPSAGGLRHGVGSHFLCHQASFHTSIPIYVQPSNGFTLPADPNAPIILIGPGTGIAPFRAFLQERMFLQQQGKNWLFFGERNRATDFYYEDYWLELERQNRLRLDLAFSRDSEEKTYVQHLLWERRAAIWEWIQNGAYLYVCGDAEKMAKDVDLTLHRIAAEQGNLIEEDAREFIKALRKERRYLQDVY